MPVRFIQAGVLKCNAPPHPNPGFVPLTLLRNGEAIIHSAKSSSPALNEVASFEYRSQVPQKAKSLRKIQVSDKRRPAIDELISGGSELQDNKFKVRVIERL